MTTDSATLIAAIDSRVERVRTRSLDISFNELLDMHESGELVIRPEYQRLFRWSDQKQSQFIESLALEMPIPPVFVIEIDEGRYELIDGLQRISTYLHFRGRLPDTDEPFTLEHCDILPELNGHTFDTLPHAIQIKLRRPFVRVEIIRKGSDVRYRYHMFKRLNTGGELLSEQEVRNCTIRLLSTGFNDFLIACAKNAEYQRCMTRVSDNKKQMMYLEECALRFFALRNDLDSYDHLVGEFLTQYMEAVSDPDNATSFDEDAEGGVFKRTFEVLAASLGDQAFSTCNPDGNLMNNFSVNHFEALTVAVATHVDALDPSDGTKMAALKDALVELKRSDEFLKVTRGGGLNYPSPLKARIQLADAAVVAL